MSRLRNLTAQQARGTLAHRLVPLVDRMRQMETEFGLRPYATFLVWARWTGPERGEGRACVMTRVPILPNPEVRDLTAVVLRGAAAGILPAGSVQVGKISPRYAQDMLMGLRMPCDPKADFDRRLVGSPPESLTAIAIESEEVPEPYEFFYEIVEDGRSNDGRPSPRARFRPLSVPFRKAGDVEWTVTLERVSEDMERDGSPPGREED